VRFPSAPRVVITGAGSGLGRALALEFARRGGRVLITDVNLAGAEETAVLVRADGGEAYVQACDVSQAPDVEACAVEVERRWGGVDVLVNNAGVASGGRVGEVSLAEWERTIRINLWGAIHGCHVFVPRMRHARAGWILNVASAAGFASLPEMATYNVTKAAVISLSETLHAELRPHGIHVSVLCPTFFPTNLHTSLAAADERTRRLTEALFRRARSTAEEVAREGVRGLERGKLHILPQADGRWLWLAKRLLPGLYARTVGRHHDRLTSNLLK